MKKQFDDDILKIIHHDLNEKKQFDEVFAIFYYKNKLQSDF